MNRRLAVAEGRFHSASQRGLATAAALEITVRKELPQECQRQDGLDRVEAGAGSERLKQAARWLRGFALE